MPAIIEPVRAPTENDPSPSWLGRWGWFFALAAGGVLATAVVATVLHVLMRL